MARYSLRNQEKIKSVLGVDFHKWLIASLNAEFAKETPIYEFHYAKEKYTVIHVSNVQPNTDSIFELYVIGKKYDVYNLAYKSCMG